MHWYWLALVPVVALVLVLDRRRVSVRKDWPVFTRQVLTEPERVLYGRLREALPKLLVFPQVQLCRFVEVQNVQGRRAVLNRYDRLSADFVICRDDSAPVAVVELDDSTHDRPASRERDAKKDAVLAAAGVRLLRWRARSMPDVSAIRQEFAELIGGGQQRDQSGKQVVGARL